MLQFSQTEHSMVHKALLRPPTTLATVNGQCWTFLRGIPTVKSHWLCQFLCSSKTRKSAGWQIPSWLDKDILQLHFFFSVSRVTKIMRIFFVYIFLRLVELDTISDDHLAIQLPTAASQQRATTNRF